MSATLAEIDLPIRGMTCASCASRIERKLNKLDGVTATVNYATEKASVAYDAAAVEPEQLLAAVEAAGYSAALPAAWSPPRWPPAPLRRGQATDLPSGLPLDAGPQGHWARRPAPRTRQRPDLFKPEIDEMGEGQRSGTSMPASGQAGAGRQKALASG